MGLLSQLGEDFDVGAVRSHARRPDEDAAQRGLVARSSRSASKLETWRPYALRRNLDVDQAEVLAVEDDQARAACRGSAVRSCGSRPRGRRGASGA